MAQFGQMFGTARIPGAKRDTVRVASAPTHVVVLCRNQFYFFDALWPTGELGVTEQELEYNIRAILAGSAEDSDAVCPNDLLSFFLQQPPLRQ